MPMTTPGGESSYKFDRETDPETKQRLWVMDEDINQLRQNVAKTREYIDSQLFDFAKDHDTDRHMLQNQIDGILSNYANNMELLKIFTSSKLFRFLNFFGQWYIFGDNGYIWANTATNSQYGKRPFLTRLRIWFETGFNKIRKHLGDWIHTISKDKEKGGH